MSPTDGLPSEATKADDDSDDDDNDDDDDDDGSGGFVCWLAELTVVVVRTGVGAFEARSDVQQSLYAAAAPGTTENTSCESVRDCFDLDTCDDGDDDDEEEEDEEEEGEEKEGEEVVDVPSILHGIVDTMEALAVRIAAASDVSML